MKSIASTLSSRILTNLNQGKARYTEQDLEIAEFPSRLKQKVLSITESRFKESVSEPESKWLDSDAENIKKAWQTYLRQAERELILPQDEIRNVTESAMEQLLNVHCKPREYIIEVLFGEASEQTKEDLKSRFERTDEHHYLGYALLRYMDKRELVSVTRERADELLLTIDQKITESYNASDWGKLLKPVFELGGGTVPASLIQVFFEEKQLHDMAHKFDAATELTARGLTEIVSADEPTDQVNEEIDLDAASPGANVAETEKDKEEDLKSPFLTVNVNESDEADSEDPEAESLAGEFTDTEVAKEDADENFAGSLFDTFNDPEEEETEPEAVNSEEDTEPENVKEYGVFPGFFVDEPEGEEMADESEDQPTLAGRFVFDEEETTPWIGEEETEDQEEEAFPWIGGDTSEVEEEDETISWIGEDESEDPEEESIPWVGEDESEDTDEEEDTPPDDGDSVAAQHADPAEPSNEEDGFPWVGEDENEDPEEEPIPWIGEDESENEENEPISWIGEDENEENETTRWAGEGASEETPFLNEGTSGSLFNDEEPEEKGDATDEKNESAFLPASDTDGEEPDEHVPEEKDDKKERPVDTPMWKSFLEREDADEKPFYSEEHQQQEEITDEMTPQPAYPNLFSENEAGAETESQPQRPSDFDRLVDWLKKDEKRYLKKLFKNSRIAYEQALTDLMVFDDWKSASGYLEREIFVKNQIDLFSEPAVDFTDKLHSFFVKKKS